MDDVHRRLEQLEELVEHLYRQLDVQRPTGLFVSDTVRQLASSGNTIAAIKRYREETGADLLTAKTVVDGL
jgi:ribosomal protein L7/L12